MSALIRVGIVDAHPLFRGGVVETLSASGDCQVVAEGACRAEAVRIAGQCAPDVMLLDLHSEFSIEAVRRLASKFRFMRTIILTGTANEDQVVATLEAGAAGYILKGVSGPELVESVRRVHRGECYVYPALAAKLIVSRGSQILDRFFRGGCLGRFLPVALQPKRLQPSGPVVRKSSPHHGKMLNDEKA